MCRHGSWREDLLGKFTPVRGLPISDIPKADTNSLSARRFFAKPMWSNLQIIELTKEIVDTTFTILYIITNAYTEWGLLNLGKPMAARAIKAVKKTSEDVKDLSSSLT